MVRKRSWAVFAVMTAISFAAAASGCSLGQTSNVSTAKTKAADYIKDKYGFDAEIIDASMDTRGGLAPLEGGTALSTALVTMEHDGREFYVEINTETDKGFDNYQVDEISKAFEEKINSEIPGGKLVLADYFGHGYTSDRIFTDDNDDNGMVPKEAYFDGNDLTGVLESSHISVIMYYTDTEFHDCELFRDFKRTDNSVQLVSFNSEEITDKCINSGFYFDEREYLLYAPHITDRWETSRFYDGSHGNYDLRDGGDFLYYSPYADEDTEFSVTDTDPKPVVNAANKEKTGSILKKYYTAVTPAYTLSTGDHDDGRVYVFYPIDKLDVPENEIITCAAYNRSTDYSNTPLSYHRGGYIVFETNVNTLFCLVDTGEKFKVSSAAESAAQQDTQ